MGLGRDCIYARRFCTLETKNIYGESGRQSRRSVYASALHHFYVCLLTTSDSAECIICTERRRSSAMYRAPCGHLYCVGCLVDLVDASTRDETLFPLRCCHRPFPEEDILRRLSSRLRATFSGKAIEYRVPAAQRIYCINPVCSAFLGPAGEDNTYLVCLRCQTSVCTGCKNEGHPGEMCRENEAVQLLETLATDNGWRRCAGCNVMVELSDGCYHMTCR